MIYIVEINKYSIAAINYVFNTFIHRWFFCKISHFLYQHFVPANVKHLYNEARRICKLWRDVNILSEGIKREMYRSKRKEERKESDAHKERKKEMDCDWTIAGCRCRAQKQAGGRRRCARLYTASTATTALTCHHIDIVTICKCARTYSWRWGLLESNVLFWVMEALEKEIIMIHCHEWRSIEPFSFLYWERRMPF